MKYFLITLLVTIITVPVLLLAVVGAAFLFFTEEAPATCTHTTNMSAEQYSEAVQQLDAQSAQAFNELEARARL